MGCSNNCIAWENGDHHVYKADPDIAGPGVLAVFITSSTFALFLSLGHIILTPAASPVENVIDFWVSRVPPLIRDIFRDPISIRRHIVDRKAHVPQLPEVKEKNEFWARFIEKIILNLSDQLLLTGTAILIAGFWTHCSISVYHFAMISDLAWFASNVHLITIVVLSQYLQDRPVLRNWRAFLICCMAVFLTVSTILQGHRYWYVSWPYDAQCVFNDFTPANVGGLPARWMYTNLALIVIGFPPSILGLYQAPRDLAKKWFHDKVEAAFDSFIRSWRVQITIQPTLRAHDRYHSYWSLRRCAETCLKCYMFLYKLLASVNDSRWFNLLFCLAWFGFGLVNVFRDRNIPRWDMDGSENAMTFGQLVPILLLSSTFLVAREAYDDISIDMKKKDLSQGHSSTASLVHTRSTSAQGSPPGQSFEMSGARQASDDHPNRIPSSTGQVGTQTGHGSQSSGIDGVRQKSETVKRSTWPKDGVARPETDRTLYSLREETNSRRDH